MAASPPDAMGHGACRSAGCAPAMFRPTTSRSVAGAACSLLRMQRRLVDGRHGCSSSIGLPSPSGRQSHPGCRRRAITARRLDFGSLRVCQGVLRIHATVSRRALQPGVVQQDLRRLQIARSLINKSNLGPAQAVGAVGCSAKLDRLDPVAFQTGATARVQVLACLCPAWGGIVLAAAANLSACCRW